MATKQQPLKKGVIHLVGDKVQQWMHSIDFHDDDLDAPESNEDEDRQAVEAYQMRTAMQKMQAAVTLLAEEVRDLKRQDTNGGTRRARSTARRAGQLQVHPGEDGPDNLAAVSDQLYGILDDFCDKTKQSRGSAELGSTELQYLYTVGSELRNSLGKVSAVTMFPASNGSRSTPPDQQQGRPAPTAREGTIEL
jgi:hypothetical protein